MSKIKAISLFSSAGIGELLLHNTNVEVIAGNELLPKRAECYQHFYPNSRMHCLRQYENILFAVFLYVPSITSFVIHYL